MADNYTVQVPAITAVSIAPNPAQINRAITIAVTITERSVTLSPEERFSGELYLGEV